MMLLTLQTTLLLKIYLLIIMHRINRPALLLQSIYCMQLSANRIVIVRWLLTVCLPTYGNRKKYSSYQLRSIYASERVLKKSKQRFSSLHVLHFCSEATSMPISAQHHHPLLINPAVIIGNAIISAK